MSENIFVLVTESDGSFEVTEDDIAYIRNNTGDISDPLNDQVLTDIILESVQWVLDKYRKDAH